MVYPAILHETFQLFHLKLKEQTKQYNTMIKKEWLKTLLMLIMFLYSNLLKEGKIENIVYERSS